MKSVSVVSEQRITASNHWLWLGRGMYSCDYGVYVKVLCPLKSKQQHLYACSAVRGAEGWNVLLSCSLTAAVHQ